MQRGRGRGRGRNPNPARSTSRRGSRSTSRRTISHSRTRTSLRRSSRIAELLNGEINGDSEPPTNGSMADVARPRALGSRSVRSRQHHSGNSRRSRSGRHTVSPENIRYAMDIIVQPPPSAYAGHSMNGTIVVRLRTTNAIPEDAIADSSNLVALATLIPDPSSAGSTDPAYVNGLLAGPGRRVVSIQPFSDDEADGSIASMELDDPRGVGYMRFSDLVIRQAGTYRIRITLLRIRNSSSDPPVATITGGTSVQFVDSNPIVVQGSGPTPNLAAYNGDDDDNEDDGGWTDLLRSIQTRQRSQ